MLQDVWQGHWPPTVFAVAVVGSFGNEFDLCATCSSTLFKSWQLRVSHEEGSSHIRGVLMAYIYSAPPLLDWSIGRNALRGP